MRIHHRRKLVVNRKSLSVKKQRSWRVRDPIANQLNGAMTRSKWYLINCKCINRMRNHSFRLKTIKQLTCRNRSAGTPTLAHRIWRSIFIVHNWFKYSLRMSKFKDSRLKTSHFCRVKILRILQRCKISSWLIRSVLRIRFRSRIMNRQKFKILWRSKK